MALNLFKKKYIFLNKQQGEIYFVEMNIELYINQNKLSNYH